jgi:hypothetical protein
MANLTFSKKGVPMGRNKSASVNASSQWSEAEDNYLRMTAEQNMSANMVASKLGRTTASVHTRKWNLGIKNNRSVPRIKAPKNAKPMVSPKSQMVVEKTPKGIQLFKMESNVPMPSRGSRSNEEARNNIRNLFSQMNVGQSFVVPQKMVHVAKYISDKEFPAFKIKTSATTQDKKFHRIFRVA